MSDQPRKHLSATQLDMYTRCAEQYRRRYVEGEIIAPRIAMLKGTGFHKGAEANMRQKLESRVDLPKSDIVEIAVSQFDLDLKGGYQLDSEEVAIGRLTVIDTAKQSLVALATLHALEQAPEYQPVMVEERVTLELPGPRDLVGIIDLADDKGRVIDFKTAGRKKSQDDADSSVQLTVYAAAFESLTGAPPSELRLDCAIETKKATARQVLMTDRNDFDFAALANRINVVAAAIEAGSFPPAAPGSWWCNPRFCGFWDTCPLINPRRGRRLAQGD